MWKLGGGGLPTRPSPLTNKLEAVAAAAAKLIGPILRINGEGKQRVDVGRVRREAAMNHGRADATQDVTLGACKTHQVPRRGPARGRTPPSVECEEWWGGDARPERLDADPLGRAGTTCEPQTLVRGSRRKENGWALCAGRWQLPLPRACLSVEGGERAAGHPPSLPGLWRLRINVLVCRSVLHVSASVSNTDETRRHPLPTERRQTSAPPRRQYGCPKIGR